jgi:hypothetical protein
MDARGILPPGENVRVSSCTLGGTETRRNPDIRPLTDRYREGMKDRGCAHKCNGATQLMSPKSRPGLTQAFWRPDKHWDCRDCGPVHRAEHHVRLRSVLREELERGRTVYRTTFTGGEKELQAWCRRVRRDGAERYIGRTSVGGFTALHTSAAVGGEEVEDLDAALFALLSGLRPQARKGERLVLPSKAWQSRMSELRRAEESAESEGYIPRGWGRVKVAEVESRAAELGVEVVEDEDLGRLFVKPEGMTWEAFVRALELEPWEEVKRRRSVRRLRRELRRRSA